MIQKTNALHICFRQLKWLAGLWFGFSACQPGENPEVIHDAKWTADSIRLYRIADSINTNSVQHDYKKLLLLLPEYNSVSVCKNYPEAARMYFAWLLKANAGYSYDTASTMLVIRLLGRFQELADSTKDERLITWSEYFLARFYNEQGDAKVSLPMMLSVGAKFEKLRDTVGMSVVSKRIGGLYHYLFADYKKAIPYYWKATSLTRDPIEQEIIAGLLAEEYLYLGNMDSAQFFFRKVSHWSLSQSLGLYFAVHSFKGDSSKELMLIRRKFAVYIQWLKSLKNEDYVQVLWKATNYISKILLDKNDPVNAEWFINRALQFDSLCNVCDLDRVELYRNKEATYSLRNDIPNAYKWNHKLVDAIEKLNEKKGNEKMEKISMRFKVDELLKNQDKRMERQRREAEAEIEEQEFYRNISLFGFGCILVIAMMVTYTARLRRKFEIEKLRSSISRDLHDDIGSTLSSIKIISGMALEKSAANAVAREPLSRIYERSQRLLENMNDIVWSIKPMDTLGEVFVRMRLFAATIFEAKEIEYNIDFPVEIENTELPLASKNTLYFSFKELINNIARHSQAHNVNISLTIENKQLVLHIADDGQGFLWKSGDSASGKKVGFGGNGLAGIESRAKTVGGVITLKTEPGNGTQAELRIPF